MVCRCGSQEFRQIRSPELYFGYGFERPGQLGNSEGRSPESLVKYVLSDSRVPNRFYLDGSWFNAKDFMQLSGKGSVDLLYSAKQVNIVAGATEPVEVRVFVDDELVNTVTVQEHDLYTVVDGEYGAHKLRLEADGPLRMYTFTFG